MTPLKGMKCMFGLLSKLGLFSKEEGSGNTYYDYRCKSILQSSLDKANPLTNEESDLFNKQANEYYFRPVSEKIDVIVWIASPKYFDSKYSRKNIFNCNEIVIEYSETEYLVIKSLFLSTGKIIEKNVLDELFDKINNESETYKVSYYTDIIPDKFYSMSDNKGDTDER